MAVLKRLLRLNTISRFYSNDSTSRQGLLPISALQDKRQIVFSRHNQDQLFDSTLPGVAVEEVTAQKSGIQTFFPSSDYRFAWTMPPQNVLLIQKPGDISSRSALLKIAQWLQTEYKINVIMEHDVAHATQQHLSNVFYFKEQLDQLARTIDFIVAIGGDGTLLHVSSLFKKNVPPVVCFSMGSLGFLMPFAVDDYRQVIANTISGHFPFMPRMRLSCSLSSTTNSEEFQVMNEAVVHRRNEPGLVNIDVFVNNQLLTNTMTDGLILATPTGSTAYSLSAGGSVVHPSVKSILLTPIAPRSLSFRPALFPPDTEIKLRVSSASRSSAVVSFDGRDFGVLKHDDYLRVVASQFPVPTVTKYPTKTKEWVEDINNLLHWNIKWR